MGFTYPERVRRLIDVPNVTNGTWRFGSTAQVRPGGHDGPRGMSLSS